MRLKTLDAVLKGAARAAANPKTERAANVSRRSRETTSYERDFMLSRIRSLVFKIKKANSLAAVSLTASGGSGG